MYEGAALAGAVLLAATAAGLWWRARDGRLTPEEPVDDHRLDPALRDALGVLPGEVTLLQFSTAFCAPCRATRAVLAGVGRDTDGVRHVEVDAESHLDAVRALKIWATPTTLIIDAQSRIVGRAGGVPTRPQVLAAVAALIPRKEEQ
ncbi:TlpA family protein disulfide reductase [Catenuloplanes atrovinosus]|uniref:Thiol-disulfide isomerase/thioredoxin n=1 Tax=Catenuloplanes atrovinosus TaxID=137266 RepID=A0AAE3YMP8_9ACTN|nr:thioredoxin family protein [Catenuloplanes atrovinosus]MDR7276320.1 thiol-disulfide isomerase/thioredoxin [Catenuloplanes atrovinosus]